MKSSFPIPLPCLVILVGTAFVFGCRDETPPETPLDPNVDYLTAVRMAAGPEAVARLEETEARYEEYRAVRHAELKSHPYPPEYDYWSEEELLGWDIWVNWTGGNQFFWRELAAQTDGELNLLKLLDNNLLPREERFSRFGLINDPFASAPTEVDEYGYRLDKIDYYETSDETKRLMGRPGGIVGMRLFDNPKFDPGAWDSSDPWANAGEVEPPYLIGISCGFCHISFSPTKPPEDIQSPTWENLASALGNIYFKEGPMFAWVQGFPVDDFRYHYLESQPPGTSDTSRIAADDIDNPNAINAIFNLPERLTLAFEEVMPNGYRDRVPHVLKDGADSVGVAVASLRVYVNIGLNGKYWLTRHDAYAVLGRPISPQQPFEIKEAMKWNGDDDGSTYYWDETQVRMDDAAAYLSSLKPMKLADAPGGQEYLSADEETLNRGKRVFGENCARCHSSKQPPGIDDRESEEYRTAMAEMVMEEDFFEGNFLSDDQRYSVVEVGTNIARAVGSNAIAGHIWDNFSSQTYKELPAVGSLTLEHPTQEGKTLDFKLPGGGRGYYRTASLINIWSTAPFFHNNSLGQHLQDPSVERRMEAFQDAAEKLLGLKERDHIIKRTTANSWVEAPNQLIVPAPAGTPIKLVGNLPLHQTAEALQALNLVPGLNLDELLSTPFSPELKAKKEAVMRKIVENETTHKALDEVLLKINLAPDFVEDRGHEDIVAKIASDDDRRALLELMKTF